VFSAARTYGLLAVLLVAAGTVTACDASPDRGSAAATARSFVTSLQRKDGAAACALLSSNAKSSVSGATNASCARAVTNVSEQGATVSHAQVWGDAAQVHVGSDVVFLRRVAGRWVVSAAGCKWQPAGPYDCDIGG
jgi:hypothetical protein